MLPAGFGQGFGCVVEVEVAQGVFQPRGVVGKGRLEKSGAHTQQAPGGHVVVGQQSGQLVAGARQQMRVDRAGGLRFGGVFGGGVLR